MRYAWLLLLAACGAPVVYRADRVFDGNRLWTPGYVAVEGDRIVSVGDRADGDVVDLGDVTILPGLIDTGVDLDASGGANLSPVESSEAVRVKNLLAYFYWGVTAVRGRGAGPGPRRIDGPRGGYRLAAAEGFARLGREGPVNVGVPRAVAYSAAHAPAVEADLAAVVGAPHVVGSGAGSPGAFHGFSTVREIELLVDAGLSPESALLAATRDAAAHLGAADLGTLEAGKLADFIVVDGDPLSRISDLRRVTLTVQGGRVFPRESFSFAAEYAEPGVTAAANVNWREGWDVLTDQSMGGASEGRLLDVGHLRLEGELSPKVDAVYAFVGARKTLDASGFRVVDASAYSGVRFRVRGTPRRYRAVVGCAPVAAYDDHGFSFEADGSWRTVEVRFADLSRLSAGPAFDAASLTYLLFRSAGPPADGFELEIDSVSFYEFTQPDK